MPLSCSALTTWRISHLPWSHLNTPHTCSTNLIRLWVSISDNCDYSSALYAVTVKVNTAVVCRRKGFWVEKKNIRWTHQRLVTSLLYTKQKQSLYLSLTSHHADRQPNRCTNKHTNTLTHAQTKHNFTHGSFLSSGPHAGIIALRVRHSRGFDNFQTCCCSPAEREKTND